MARSQNIWLNRDPFLEPGAMTLLVLRTFAASPLLVPDFAGSGNPYDFDLNDPEDNVDPVGLALVPGAGAPHFPHGPPPGWKHKKIIRPGPGGSTYVCEVGVKENPHAHSPAQVVAYNLLMQQLESEFTAAAAAGDAALAAEIAQDIAYAMQQFWQ
jgi:hypothetical protein